MGVVQCELHTDQKIHFSVKQRMKKEIKYLVSVIKVMSVETVHVLLPQATV